MNNVPEIFGSNVFNDNVMRERLPKDVYKALKKTIEEGKTLDISVANVVANSMKDWACERGVTHYTHWFQPMTGVTAEKHDSFITPVGNGKIIMEFSGKELIKGEPDASSFPSGGLRATFEARGYTAWDPTSYAFIKDGILCIPTAFCSFSGEVLDKKTPLLRSMEVINVNAKRILKLFGKEDVKRVITTVGAEQEYFLIDKSVYEKRPDLIFTGRTLCGAKPPKGQELDDHYFGAIKPRVSEFMKELDEELWKLGVLAKTKHNEAAPAQHELAPIFETTNLATDQNQLTMETMRKVASKYNMVCLLHEKPFDGVNGSGKHNNWSMSTNTGINLLEPGKSPEENAQFLLFLCAVIEAVHEHQDLLRMSVASAGNDHRLGGNEAPPAIISMFLGDELTSILKSLETDSEYDKIKRENLEIGVDVLPNLPKDTSDRNRTSPFAFTGNKFEFRMVGSSSSISSPNIILNTIIGDVLDKYATRLEKAQDFRSELNKLIKETIKNHKDIIFNGNNYSDEWVEEAKNRGLLNLKSTPEAIQSYVKKENIELFVKHKIFSEAEVKSRCEIMLENYCKVLKIEALTFLEMLKRDIIPAVVAYEKDLVKMATDKKVLMGDEFIKSDLKMISRFSHDIDNLYGITDALLKRVNETNEIFDIVELSNFYRDEIVTTMEDARLIVDGLEANVGRNYWPYPSYGEMLFSIQ